MDKKISEAVDIPRVFDFRNLEKELSVSPSSQEDSAKKFADWLHTTGEEFFNLTDEQKITTLDYLVDLCNARQLLYLEKQLESLVKRDFLKLLPLELSHHLLSFLDAESLKNCCLISKHWYYVIKDCVPAWQRACQTINIRLDHNETHYDGKYLRKLYLCIAKRVIDLKESRAFETQILPGHKSKVTALHYNNGLLATGSNDNTVKIWNSRLGECLHTLSVPCTISDIQFDEERIVIAGFYGIIYSWDVRSGEPLAEFHRHVGSIFSISYSQEINLLISGAADMTIKLWSLSDGRLLTTLNGHEHWITKVILKKLTVDTPSVSAGKYILISMDRFNICIWPINPDGSGIECLKRIYIPGNENFYFTLGLHFDGQLISFVKNMDGVHILCRWDITQYAYVLEQEHEMRIRMLLGIGDKFTAVLIDNWDKLGMILVIINTMNKEMLAAWFLPMGRITTPNSQYCLCESSWLNGFDGFNDSGVVLSASLEDSMVCQVQWKRRLLLDKHQE